MPELDFQPDGFVPDAPSDVALKTPPVPDEQKDVASDAVYYGETFGLDPGTFTPITEEINDFTNFVPSKATPAERGFFNKVGESYRRGDEQIKMDVAFYESFFEGRGNPQEMFDAMKKFEELNALDPIEGSFTAELFYGAANIIPGMKQGLWSAVPEAFAGMMTGIGMAALFGQAGPQVGLPEEIITIPIAAQTGIAVGLKMGGARFWYKQGAGQMAFNMMKEGYDPDVSRNVAAIAAIPYAAIELAQVEGVTPGLRKTMQKTVQKSVLKVLGKAAKKYGNTWGQEVLEEVAQEVIQVTAEDIAGVLSDADIELDADFFLDRADRILETATESAKSMALLPIPGAAIDIRSGLRSMQSEKQRAKQASQVPIDSAAPFTSEEKNNLTEAAKAQIQKMETKGPLTQQEQQTLEFLRSNQNIPDNLIYGMGLSKDATTDLSLTGDILIDTANGDVQSLLDEIASTPIDQGSRKLVFRNARDATNAREVLANIAVSRGIDMNITTQGPNMFVTELTDEQAAGLTAEEQAIVAETLAELEATPREAVEKKIADDVDLTEQERDLFPDLAEREDDIKELEKVAPKKKPFSKVVSKEIAEEEFKEAGDTVDGREVRKDIPNQDSIEATFGSDFEILPGVREVSLSEFEAPPDINPRTQALAEEIRESDEINPLIVAVDEGGPYILEGANRFDALKILGAKSFPAQVVIDTRKVEVAPQIIVPEQIQKGKPFKPVSKKGPGLTKAEIALLTPEQQREARFAQLEGKPVGFKAGTKEERAKARRAADRFTFKKKLTQARREAARALMRAFVPREEQGRFITRLTQEGLTEGQHREIKEAILKGIDRAERKHAVGGLRKAIKSIKPKKMLPEFRDAAKKVVDTIQFKERREETVLKLDELKEMAEQVLKTVHPESVTAMQANALIEDIKSKTGKEVTVSNLTLEEIEQITDLLNGLRGRNDADTLAAQGEAAEQAKARRKEMTDSIRPVPTPPNIFTKKITASLKAVKLLHDNLESANDSVAGGTHGIYETWKTARSPFTKYIYDVLNAGSDNQSRHNRKAKTLVREIFKKHGVKDIDILNWSIRPEEVSILQRAMKAAEKRGITVPKTPAPKVFSFGFETISGAKKSFDFTVSELMSVFMHTRTPHNRNVLLREGFNRRVGKDLQEVRGITITILDEMADTLTTQQKSIAREIGVRLMDGLNKKAINEVSTRIDFKEIAVVDNYWPAPRSITRALAGKKPIGIQSLIEGMGFLKERIGTGNPLRLNGFFDTVYKTNKNVAAYVGLAEPLREVKAVYTPKMMDTLRRAGREAEAKQIKTMLERFEDNSAQISPLEGWLAHRLGNFAASTLSLHPKIAVRQRISEMLVTGYMDTKYLSAIKPTADKATLAAIRELSPQTADRFDGMQFDRDVGDIIIQNELMHYFTGKLPIRAHFLAPMRYFDTQAIADVYRMVKAEVRDKNPGATGKDFDVLLKDRFEWMVRHTQPMWSQKDRSLISSSPNLALRTVTMFMSAREVITRMATNAITEYLNSKQTAADARVAGKALGAVMFNMVMFTLFNAAHKAITRKEPPELADLMTNLFSDIASLPFFGKYIGMAIKQISGIVRGKPQRMRAGDSIFADMLEGMFTALSNYTLAATHLITGEKYERGPNKGDEKWKNEVLVATDSLIEVIAQIEGIPYTGPADIVRTLKTWFGSDTEGSQAIKR